MGLSTDREKIVKGLEYHLKELSIGKTCFECPYCGDNPCEIQLVANALALLKEQQENIASLQGTISKLNAALGEQPEIVRCKDCKHSKDEYGGMFCPKFGFVHQEDWFCADGERRDGDG